MKRTKNYQVLLEGSYACFTREAFKGDRLSYEVITPPAARGVLENILWRRGFKWVVSEIRVLRPIRWQSFTRNEQGRFSPNLNLENTVHGMQRRTQLLADVAYLVTAHIESVGDCTGAEIQKMQEMATRYLRKGKCWHPPYLGMSDYPAKFTLIEEGEAVPEPLPESQDFGWMLHSYIWDDAKGIRTSVGLFRATMTNGIVPVPQQPERVQEYRP